MKIHFHWEHDPKDFQLKAILAQLKRRDVLVHAGTGAGKTAIAAGPHTHPSCKDKVTIMVSPLIALHDEQVSQGKGANSVRHSLYYQGRNLPK